MSRSIACVVTLVALAAAGPARAATISLAAAPTAGVGTAFDVHVRVSDVFGGRALDDALLAFGFDVSVGNPAVLQYLDFTVDPLFFPLSLGTPMVAGIAVSPLGVGPLDFVAPLTLATLHFNVLAPGFSTFGVTWDSSDLNQGLVFFNLPVDGVEASASVTAAAASVPEPGTIALLGSGLAMLWRARRGRAR